MSIAFHCSKRLLIAGKKRDFAALEVSGQVTKHDSQWRREFANIRANWWPRRQIPGGKVFGGKTTLSVQDLCFQLFVLEVCFFSFERIICGCRSCLPSRKIFLCRQVQ